MKPDESHTRMPALALKIPPLLQLLSASVAAYGLSLFSAHTFWFLILLAPIFALLGLFFIGGAMVALHRAQTTVDPRDPHKTSSLIRRGVYRYSRNPIYLGMILLLMGWCCFLQQPQSFILVPLLVLSLTYWQIVPEEHILMARFAERYQEYQQRVRRWL